MDSGNYGITRTVSASMDSIFSNLHIVFLWISVLDHWQILKTKNQTKAMLFAHLSALMRF